VLFRTSFVPAREDAHYTKGRWGVGNPKSGNLNIQGAQQQLEPTRRQGRQGL